ncbi:hypothetical protein KCP76_23600 [Salmonella enterica subsp. enterica serovar Weltevreden]|nr:hypothetical protein KCP76_23600 [Salmonella enterica subsp. enterica serovar Weltevreden]
MRYILYCGNKRKSSEYRPEISLSYYADYVLGVIVVNGRSALISSLLRGRLLYSILSKTQRRTFCVLRHQYWRDFSQQIPRLTSA